jgi:hypothetical protein
VAVGLLAARPPKSPDRRRAIDRFLAYTLAVTCGVGLVQRESWPFTTWALVHGLAPKTARSWSIEATDASGRAYAVDPGILQPLAPEEFGAWLLAHEAGLDERGRQAVAAFLLDRAEAARRRFLTGGRVGPNEWLLGGLGAPYHFTGERRWREAGDVPATAFVRLLVFAVEWDVEERARHDDRLRRRLVLEVDRRAAP